MNLEDELVCKEIRKEIFMTGYAGGMAHLASCFSSLEIIYTLFLKDILRYNSKKPTNDKRDRFILSKGHAGLALYAVMYRAGYLDKNIFTSYLQPGSHIGGEPCMRDLDGIEASTGSLGHGLSMGVGMALGQKIDGHGFRTYVLLGDGECQEGTVWEALMSASALGLNNLIAILDANGIQKMDSIKNIMGFTNWRDKVTSFGWDTREVDGHNIIELKKCLESCYDSPRPVFIIAHTIKGKGVSVMENNPIWHFKLPNKKEKKIFMQELNISDEEMEP